MRLSATTGDLMTCSLFPKKPSLIEFVQILEEESKKQAAELEDIRKSRRVKPMYHI